jgi:hypothetical protein
VACGRHSDDEKPDCCRNPGVIEWTRFDCQHNAPDYACRSMRLFDMAQIGRKKKYAIKGLRDG